MFSGNILMVLVAVSTFIGLAFLFNSLFQGLMKHGEKHDRSFTERYNSYKRYKFGEYTPTPTPEKANTKEFIFIDKVITFMENEKKDEPILKPTNIEEVKPPAPIKKIKTKEVVKPKDYSPNKIVAKSTHVRSMNEILNNIKEEHFYPVVIKILNDIKKLKNDPYIMSELRHSMDIENIENNYLPKVLNLFLDLMLNKDKDNFDEADIASVKVLTNNQLNIFIEQIKVFNKFSIQQQIHRMEVNHRFLDTKFNSQEQEEEEILGEHYE